MAVVAFTGNGVVPNVAGKNFVDGKTYAGSSRAALLPQWSAAPDPFKSRLDAIRRAEEQAMRSVEEQAQAIQAANQKRFLEMEKSYPKAQDDNWKLFGGLSAIGDFLTSETPNFNITTDPVGNPLNEVKPKNEVTNVVKGPEKTGYIQQPQLDKTGNVVGYNYVKLDTSGGISPTNDTNIQPSPTGLSADAMARAAGENVIDALAGNVLKDEYYRNQLGAVRNQIYGAPKEEILPNGEVRLVYDNELLLYHGITSDMQTGGYVAGRLPDPINPNATDVEKYEYYKQGLFAPPLYKLGEEYTELATMTREEKIQLQKNLKRAGYYPSKYTIVPGIFQPDEIGYLQTAMGEANVAGLELSQLFDLRDQMRKKAIAAQGSRSGGGGGGGAATRTVDINFNTTTMANGRVLLSRVLQDALGRSPSDEELSRFMTMLNDAESKSPTKTITQYVNSGNTRKSISRTNPSDVDPEAMAREFASGVNGGNEMGSYQTNRLMSMLMNQVAGAANA
jgi:hypothetical protein